MPSIAISSRSRNVDEGPPLIKSIRLRMCVLCSFGFAIVYALRVNLSIAIVAMVKEISHPVNVCMIKILFLALFKPKGNTFSFVMLFENKEHFRFE